MYGCRHQLALLALGEALQLRRPRLLLGVRSLGSAISGVRVDCKGKDGKGKQIERGVVRDMMITGNKPQARYLLDLRGRCQEQLAIRITLGMDNNRDRASRVMKKLVEF